MMMFHLSQLLSECQRRAENHDPVKSLFQMTISDSLSCQKQHFNQTRSDCTPRLNECQLYTRGLSTPIWRRRERNLEVRAGFDHGHIFCPGSISCKTSMYGTGFTSPSRIGIKLVTPRANWSAFVFSKWHSNRWFSLSKTRFDTFMSQISLILIKKWKDNSIKRKNKRSSCVVRFIDWCNKVKNSRRNGSFWKGCFAPVITRFRPLLKDLKEIDITTLSSWRDLQYQLKQLINNCNVA